jgi:hypothetical protein
MSNRLTRQELQKRCKEHNIKANISTKDMRMCINNVMNGKEVPHKFKKQTWYQRNVNMVNAGISLTSLAISGICLYLTLKKFR